MQQRGQVIDLLKLKDSPKHISIPEGLILRDGKLYSACKGNHFRLYNLLKKCGYNVEGAVRYGYFLDKEIGYRKQFFSNLKECDEIGIPKYIKLSDQQAEAIDNLRVFYNPEQSLQEFLTNRTLNFGFSIKDYKEKEKRLDAETCRKINSVFNWNYLTFEDVLKNKPTVNSHIDKREIYTNNNYVL